MLNDGDNKPKSGSGSGRKEANKEALKKRWHELLNDAADMSIVQNPDSLKSASEDMVSRVREDERLKEAIFEILTPQACHDWVRRRLQERNAVAWHHAEQDHDPTQRGDRLRRATRAWIRVNLMQYTLMGGIPLALATRDALLRNSFFQERQGRRMMQTALWLRFIADELPKDNKEAKVQDYLTEKRLNDLQALAIERIGNAEAPDSGDTDPEAEPSIPA